MKTLTHLFLLLGSSAATASQHQHESRAAVTVLTSSGLVSGHAASGATQVSEFLGIPFAIPPLGNLRFAPPQKFTGNSSINGTSFGFSCPQITAFNNYGGSSTAGGGGGGGYNLAGANVTNAGFQLLLNFGDFGDRFSEDCLTLNVWVPNTGTKNKAVMFWVYGGSFTTGTTAIAAYNGQYLANQEDVIVVSANYRVNIFGFPGIPSEPYKNVGLLDQRMAIEWVRDNIAAFGGDPTRITMFGQSAGSASLDFYSYAYASDPIVSGFIMESGTIGFGSALPTNIAASWFNATATLGCGDSTSSSSSVLSCMRSKDFVAILNVIGSLDFEPSADNITVFSDYSVRASAGNFAKLPLLIGSADYESGIFALTDALANITYPQSYRIAFDLRSFTCPAGKRANISVANGVPTWRYRWFGEFPNTILTTIPDSGAWHASELPILFNTTPSGAGIPPPTNEEIAIGTYLRGAWAAFAKDPVNGLTNYSWPMYSPTGNTLVRLAYNNMTGTNLAMPSQYDLMCNNTFSLNGTGNATTGSGGGSSSTTSSPSPSKTSNSARLVVSLSTSTLALSWVVVLAVSVLCL